MNLNSLILASLRQELKKVLTPTVLHGDREAIRAITKRIQTEDPPWREKKNSSTQKYDVTYMVETGL